MAHELQMSEHVQVIVKQLELNMKHENSTVRTINTVMMWLFCLTVLMIIIPWETVSTEFATRIQENKIMLYFALIIEVSNFLSQGVVTFFTAISSKKNAKKLQQRVMNAVESLDFAERALLREYVLQRKSVLNLPVNEPTVRNLVDEGVLRIVNVTDNDNYKADIIISKEARPYVTYKAIGLTLGKMTEEQVSQIMSARPTYAKERFTQPNKVIIGSRALAQVVKSEKKESSQEQVAA